MKTARTAQSGAAGEGATGVMGMSGTAAAADAGDTMAVDGAPTSFGVFKPVGYVMMGLPTQSQSEALVVALQGAGWQGSAVLHFTPRESTSELEAMVDNASAVAGFGYELTLLRRYLALLKEGYRWLLVKVDHRQHAAAAAELARGCGAKLAIHYRTFTV